MQITGRNHRIDYLRAVSCIAIIFIHVIDCGILMYGQEWGVAANVAYRSVLNNLMWAVPCFIMISGALLLNPEKEIGFSKLFSGYILRLVKAIVLFGVLYVILELIFNPGLRTVQYFGAGLLEIFTGDTWSHMWYLYCMIGLYLLLPFYKMVTEHATQRQLSYLLIVYLVFRSLLPLLKAFGLDCGFYIHVSTIYPFWLFLGYYLHRYCAQRSARFYFALFAAATILLAVLTWVRWKWDLKALEQLFGYSSILVIVQAVGITGCFFQLRARTIPLVKQILLGINRHSFGIYLIHLIFIRLIYKHLHFDPFSHGGFFAITGMVLVCLVVSYAADWLLKKAPVFRHVL